MKQETILHILAFMKRANLSGEEVPAYNECTRELNEEYVKAEIKPQKIKKQK